MNLSINLALLLQKRANITPEQLAAMTLPNAQSKLFLPLRSRHRRQGSTQFCPQCLASDAHPYFRRQWRLATRLTCERHRSRLRDRCTSCNQPLAAFDQSALRPHHYCSGCGYDLRRASSIYLYAAVRRLDQCIHEVFGSDLTAQAPIDNLLMQQLLGIPQFTGVHQRKLLTGFSAPFCPMLRETCMPPERRRHRQAAFSQNWPGARTSGHGEWRQQWSSPAAIRRART